jgi:hypothetical protein
MDENERKLNDLIIHFDYLKKDHDALKHRLSLIENQSARAITPQTLKNIIMLIAGLVAAFFTINKGYDAISAHNIKQYEKEKIYSDQTKQHSPK